MKPGDLNRRLIIEGTIPQDTENVGEVAINLWEMLSTQIISIVGEGGFSALYSRSVFLARATFPWLPDDSLSPQPNVRFTLLKASLEGQTPEQASAANRLLLITLTDILASLIGEDLTTRILRSAWGNDAASLTGQEFKHEQ